MKKKLSDFLDKKKLKFNEPLKNHTTFRIGGPAAFFCEAKSLDDLIKAVNVASKLSLDFFILGGGSNLLVSDKGYQGLAIKNQAGKIKKIGQERIEVESGARLIEIINFSLNHNLLGLEDFVMIPGTVGGAVFNNIHGPEHLFGEFIETVEVLTPNGKRKRVPAVDCQFAYDKSRFQKTKEIILKAMLKLEFGKKEPAEKRMKKIIAKKSDYPQLSAGCVFRNLPKQSVGFLIDKKLKLGGKKIGQARISPAHCGFIENLGGAKAREVISLIKLIQETAEQKLGRRFEPEIIFLGFSQKELEDAKISH